MVRHLWPYNMIITPEWYICQILDIFYLLIVLILCLFVWVNLHDEEEFRRCKQEFKRKITDQSHHHHFSQLKTVLGPKQTKYKVDQCIFLLMLNFIYQLQNKSNTGVSSHNEHFHLRNRAVSLVWICYRTRTDIWTAYFGILL